MGLRNPKSYRRFVTLSLLIAVASGAMWYVLEHSTRVDMYAYMVSKIALGISVLWLVDRYAFPEINTLKEMKNGNVAYALFWLGLCVLVAAAVHSG